MKRGRGGRKGGEGNGILSLVLCNYCLGYHNGNTGVTNDNM